MKKTQRALAASTALALGATFALGSASAAQAVDIWTITSLTLDNVVLIDTNAQAGDDGGLLSVTQSHILRDGDTVVYAYDRVTLEPVAAAGASNSDNFAYVSDLKTDTAYQVVTREDITQLVALDDDGNTTATVVTLSETIQHSPDSEFDFVISGYGWIGIWEFDLTGSLKVIDPTTGLVTTLDTNLEDDYSPTPYTTSEGLGQFDGGGVGMFDGTDYWYVGSDTIGNISKFNITGDPLASEMLLENDRDLSRDTDTFMFSASDCRWFIHDESPGNLWFGQVTTGIEEPMLSADATCGGPDGPESEQLADTGVNGGEATAVAAALATLATLALLVARRRQVSAR